MRTRQVEYPVWTRKRAQVQQYGKTHKPVPVTLATDEGNSKWSHSSRKDRGERPNYWTSKPGNHLSLHLGLNEQRQRTWNPQQQFCRDSQGREVNANEAPALHSSDSTCEPLHTQQRRHRESSRTAFSGGPRKPFSDDSSVLTQVFTGTLGLPLASVLYG